MSSPRRLMSSPRMAVPQDDVFRRLNDSLSFDWRLAPYDVQQSVAHASMLAAAGIISAEDRDALHAALSRVGQEVRDNTFAFDQSDEDVHMAIERRVTELAGEAGGGSIARAPATIRSPPTWPCSPAMPRWTLRAAYVSSWKR